MILGRSNKIITIEVNNSFTREKVKQTEFQKKIETFITNDCITHHWWSYCSILLSWGTYDIFTSKIDRHFTKLII